MGIQLTKDAEKRLIASIKRYYEEKLGDEVGDLQASLLLEFFLREMAPTIYNQAITDAQAYLQEKAADLAGSCFEPEFGYWER